MGSSQFRLDVPLYCQMYLDGCLKLDELLSEMMPLGNVNEALSKLDNSSGVRTVTRF
jgi:S-(hydroxymethyl)glutathione dehydrogenase / alcohol dehydrogenase